MAWNTEIIQALIQEDYNSVISFYENKIESGSEEKSDYWALGTAHLLDGDETTAQLIWSIGLAQFELLDINAGSARLNAFLVDEALRQSFENKINKTYLIRSQIYELDPEDVDNIARLIHLKIQLKKYKPQILNDLGLVKRNNILSENKLSSDVLEKLILATLDFPGTPTVEFFRSSLNLVLEKKDFIELVKPLIFRFTYQKRILLYTEAITEACLAFLPDDLDLLRTLRYIKIELKKFKDTLSITQKLYKRTVDSHEKANLSGLWLSTILQSGDWSEFNNILRQYTDDLSKINETEVCMDADIAQYLVSQSGLFLYCKDDLVENRKRHNFSSKALEKNIDSISFQFNQISQSLAKTQERKLKIGYIGHTFRAHSVGWLCRWLFQHHDRSRFEIYIYFVNKNQSQQNCDNPFFQTWFFPYIDGARELGNNPIEIAEFIHQDGIDILVDLDSTTLGLTSHVMALKPAPIQATWLGRDAIGLSAVDYFIADPYVLPDWADQHYQESIWRLPNTYIAVSGFEIGIPTLNRKSLNIPQNAIIYLSAQAGMKRHPDHIRLQMQILHHVPDSYFLIKGIADQHTIQELFTRIAMEEKVDPHRLRFLPRDLDEYTHRANLQIADIVLDTYPYNGATTTLETLWMGIPLVTRVGEQFAARNTYAFLKNAGVEEGIAWSNEEYVNWGIRLGKEKELRQVINWKLKESKQKSPLWNANQFAQDMETAYQEMWAKYISDIPPAISAQSSFK